MLYKFSYLNPKPAQKVRGSESAIVGYAGLAIAAAADSRVVKNNGLGIATVTA